MEADLRRAPIGAPERRPKGGHLFRNADDPNEVLLLFSAEDLDKAKAFTASDDLRRVMENSGVSDKPDVYFLR